MTNLTSLQDNNTIINNLFGQDVLNRSINNEIDNDLFKELNEELANALYGKDIAEAIRIRNMRYLDDYYKHLYEKFLSSGLSKEIDLDRIGLVVVRPEMYDSREEIVKKLEDLKFEILHSGDKILNREQYITLYYHGLIHPYSTIDFPTRTLNYIDKKSYLIIVSSKDRGNVSDYLNTIKGQPGFISENTFRGYTTEVLKAYIKTRDSFYSEYNALLDPISAYRLIVDHKVDQTKTDNHHEQADFPLLYYAGQGVHIPDSTEIQRDINVICTEKELKKVIA